MTMSILMSMDLQIPLLLLVLDQEWRVLINNPDPLT